MRPDPVARAAVRGELQIPGDVTVVGMLARYHPMKDHAMSLHAAALLLERGVNAIFVHGGRDVDATNLPLTTLIRQLGLVGRVRLLGERHDVATNVGDAGQIVGETGRVVTPRDLRALADATAGLINTGPERLRQLGREARLRIERHYSLESVVDAYQTLYIEVLNRPA